MEPNNTSKKWMAVGGWQVRGTLHQTLRTEVTIISISSQNSWHHSIIH